MRHYQPFRSRSGSSFFAWLHSDIVKLHDRVDASTKAMHDRFDAVLRDVGELRERMAKLEGSL